MAVCPSVDLCSYPSGPILPRARHGYSTCSSVEQIFNRCLYRIDDALGRPWLWAINHTFLSTYLSRYSSYSFVMIPSIKPALVAFSWLGIASAQYYAITGVHDGIGTNGSRPARQNINDLQKDPYAWYVTISF